MSKEKEEIEYGCVCKCHDKEFNKFTTLCCPDCIDNHKKESWYETVKNY